MRGFIYVFILSLSGVAMGAEWTSFGLHTGSQGIGASVQQTHRLDLRSHLQVQYHTDQKASVAVSLQRHFSIVRSTSSSLVTAYSGGGLTGTSYPGDAHREYFHFEVPVGMQWESYAKHLQIFSEFALMAGPFPHVDLSLGWAMGMRGFF